MTTYDISKAGADTLYHFLYSSIREDIVHGNLSPDERLPSKRPFARELGVSVMTVENAYSQLLAEGYIYTKARRGFFVSAIERPTRKNVPPQIAKESRESKEIVQPKKPNIYADFSSTRIETSTFPFSTWAKITRKVLSENQRELLNRSPYGGVPKLRKAIAKMLRGFRNIQVHPDQIIVGAGTDYLYTLLVQLLGFEKKYGVEDPGYGKISKIYRKLGVVCNFIPLDADGVQMEQLEETCTDVVHISPSHHFPTGTVMPIGRRYELLSWASKSSNRTIVEDEYDSEFRMSGSPIPALQNIDFQGQTIYINSFSKTLASTVRIGYMVLPPGLSQKFREEFSFYTCTVSNLEQYVLAEYIDGGFYEKHINRLRNFYRKRRDTLLSKIRRGPLQGIAKISEEDAGLHFILDVKTPLADEEFCKRAEERGVRLRALSDYYTASEPSLHKFVINYSSVPEKRMDKALKILAEVAPGES